MIFFDNNFEPTLKYVMLPSPRSVLICQSFHRSQLTYFATQLIKDEKISEKFVKIVTTLLSSENFERLDENVT